LTWHGDVDATNIQVMVKDGEVTLEGTVSDRNQKRMAEDIAEQVQGVTEVQNRLRVQSESSQSNQSQSNQGNGNGNKSSTTSQQGQSGQSSTSKTRERSTSSSSS